MRISLARQKIYLISVASLSAHFFIKDCPQCGGLAEMAGSNLKLDCVKMMLNYVVQIFNLLRLSLHGSF